MGEISESVLRVQSTTKPLIYFDVAPLAGKEIRHLESKNTTPENFFQREISLSLSSVWYILNVTMFKKR